MKQKFGHSKEGLKPWVLCEAGQRVKGITEKAKGVQILTPNIYRHALQQQEGHHSLPRAAVRPPT